MSYEDLDGADEFIFCDGCGARLYVTDRTCPKCGRPAPGILSASSSSADLAAGKTASFPRLTVVGGGSERRAQTAPEILADSLDPSKTGVIATDELEAAQPRKGRGSGKGSRGRAKREREQEPRELTEEDFARPRRLRWLGPAIVLALVIVGAWFVVEDPLLVMDDFYAAFAQAASEAYPSRYESSEEEASQEDSTEVDEAASDEAAITDSTLSEAEVFSRLTELYEQIVAFQDQIGDVVDDYNGSYIASDYAKREAASASAYAMREDVQAVLDELAALQLADDSVYLEDVEHLVQLATWMYNRVNVLCESWDISLALDEGESASEHRSEIVAPLVAALDSSGVNQDVVQFETYLYTWEPTEKSADS